MDDIKLGEIYGEDRISMEVTDKCTDAGEVVSIESQWGRVPFCWNGGTGLRKKREAPDLGTSGFFPATEDDGIVLGKYSEGFILKRTRKLWSHNLPMTIRL